jgi:hypothetical protein
MSVVIKLTHEEMEAAAYEGVRRRLCNLRRGSQPLRGAFKMRTAGNAPEVWKCDIEGASAELAVCKLTNLYWSGLNKQGVDVGMNTGVRHTPHDDGHLIVYADDLDEMTMVLVTGTPPVLKVRGWIQASDAKTLYYHREGRPDTEFWVPQNDLQQFEQEGDGNERTAAGAETL